MGKLIEEQITVLNAWREYKDWFVMQGWWDASPTLQGFADWVKMYKTEEL